MKTITKKLNISILYPKHGCESKDKGFLAISNCPVVNYTYNVFTRYKNDMNKDL